MQPLSAPFSITVRSPLTPRVNSVDSESYVVLENTSIHLVDLLLSTWQQLMMTWVWNDRWFVGRVEYLKHVV